MTLKSRYFSSIKVFWERPEHSDAFDKSQRKIKNISSDRTKRDRLNLTHLALFLCLELVRSFVVLLSSAQVSQPQVQLPLPGWISFLLLIENYIEGGVGWKYKGEMHMNSPLEIEATLTCQTRNEANYKARSVVRRKYSYLSLWVRQELR